MSTILSRAEADELLQERYPVPYLTFLYTLRRRAAIPADLFYAYWRDTHCQVSSRLPGQHSLWIHLLDFERGRLWPAIAGVGRELAEEDRFDGVPEPVFLAEEDLARFARAMEPLEDDEANVFEETIAYRALGDNSRTYLDRLPDPAPVFDEGALRFLIFCKQAQDVDPEAFRTFMRERLVRAWVSSEELLKLRMHLFEPYVSEQLLMDSTGVSHDKAPDKQYQACLEVVFPDALAMRRFAAGPLWLADEQRAFIREQHPFLVWRRYCMRYHDELTLTGRRTAAVAEQILRVGALNQVGPAVTALLDGDHSSPSGSVDDSRQTA
jgi:hypothetical protein